MKKIVILVLLFLSVACVFQVFNIQGTYATEIEIEKTADFNESCILVRHSLDSLDFQRHYNVLSYANMYKDIMDASDNARKMVNEAEKLGSYKGLKAFGKSYIITKQLLKIRAELLNHNMSKLYKEYENLKKKKKEIES